MPILNTETEHVRSCRLTRKTHMEEMLQKLKKFDDFGHNSMSSPCADLYACEEHIQAQVYLTGSATLLLISQTT